MRTFSSRFPSIGGVARLAIGKRWLSAHMFSADITGEAVELLVAATFTSRTSSCSCYPATSSTFAGFHRFLHLLADFERLETVLIVDLLADSEDDPQRMSAQQIEQILSKFKQLRTAQEEESHTFPNAFLVLATNDDLSGIRWTKHGPNAQTLARMSAYARTATDAWLQLFCTNNLIDNSLSWATIFKTPYELFDALIHINPAAVSGQHLAKAISKPNAQLLQGSKTDGAMDVDNGKSNGDSESKSVSTNGGVRFKAPIDSLNKKELAQYLRKQRKEAPKKRVRPSLNAEDCPLVGFDAVVCYLNEVRLHFGSVATFHYDALGGQVIGVFFNRQQLQTHSFSVRAALHSQPVVTEGVQQLDDHVKQSSKTPSKTKKKETKVVKKCVGIQANIDAIITDWKTMGQGIVSHIVLRTQTTDISSEEENGNDHIMSE